MAKGTTEAERRAERLAKALRANLGRRKAQARGRDAAEKSPDERLDSPPGAKMPQGEEG